MEEILHQFMIGGSSHYLQGFIHPRWCRISSINSIICVFYIIKRYLNYVYLDPPRGAKWMEKCAIKEPLRV